MPFSRRSNRVKQQQAITRTGQVPEDDSPMDTGSSSSDNHDQVASNAANNSQQEFLQREIKEKYERAIKEINCAVYASFQALASGGVEFAKEINARIDTVAQQLINALGS